MQKMMKCPHCNFETCVDVDLTDIDDGETYYQDAHCTHAGCQKMFMVSVTATFSWAAGKVTWDAPAQD